VIVIVCDRCGMLTTQEDAKGLDVGGKVVMRVRQCEVIQGRTPEPEPLLFCPPCICAIGRPMATMELMESLQEKARQVREQSLDGLRRLAVMRWR
jgi:hypothetical protein